MSVSTENHYELHITYAVKDASIIRACAGATGCKFSQMDGDPVLGPHVYCYLSAHSVSMRATMEGMDAAVEYVQKQYGITPIRTKIEMIVFDKRWT